MIWFFLTLALTVSGSVWTRRPAHLLVAPFALVGGYVIAYLVTGMAMAAVGSLLGDTLGRGTTPSWVSVGAAALTLAVYVTYCATERSRRGGGAATPF